MSKDNYDNDSHRVDDEATDKPTIELCQRLKDAIVSSDLTKLAAILRDQRQQFEAAEGLFVPELDDIPAQIVSEARKDVLETFVRLYPRPQKVVLETLVQATSQNRLEFLRYILEEYRTYHDGTDTHDDANDNTLLHVAADSGHSGIVEYLLAHGSDIDAVNSSGLTPLGLAVSKGHAEVVRILIQTGAETRSRSSINLVLQPSNIPHLMLAAHLGHPSVVSVLLEEGLGHTEINQFKQNALMIASKKGFVDIVNLLLDAGYNQESKDRFGYTPLMYAVVEGHIEVVKILLDRGCNPTNTRWSAKDTALHFAASYGHLDITALLLEYIPDPDIPDCIGITPLYLAAEEGHLNVVKLLAPKCNLYGMCGDRGRPLDAAVEYGHLDCLTYFLENGDTVEMKDTGGRTPLMKAACRGHVEIVEFLLKEGSDIHAEDKLQKTALSYAVMSMNPNCVEVLLSAGASLNSVDSDGVTPFMIAIKVGQPAIVSLFILAGAILEERGRVNRALEPVYPLELAVKQENFEVVQLLITAGCAIHLNSISSQITLANPAWSADGEFRSRRALLNTADEAVRTPSGRDENEAVKSYLRKHASQPYTLKCHCRKAIWKPLPKPFWLTVDKLPLPSLIKNYLLMADCPEVFLPACVPFLSVPSSD